LGNPSHKGYGGDSWGADFFDDDQKLRDDVALLGQILEMFIKNEDPGVSDAVEALTSFGRKVSLFLSSQHVNLDVIELHVVSGGSLVTGIRCWKRWLRK
jgi:hypothetical protein